MTALVPFQYKSPFRPEDEEYTVYMVNEDDPKRSGHVQTHLNCPNCSKGNYFRFYLGEEVNSYEHEGWLTEQYDCKCPECRQEFLGEVEHEMEG